MMTREIRILGIGKHWGREETRHCHRLSISKRCLKLDYQKFYIGGIAKDIELKKKHPLLQECPNILSQNF
jgi:hypothetical protein